MNITHAIGPYILSDRRNTNRATNDAIAATSTTRIADVMTTTAVIMITEITTIMNDTATTDMPHSAMRACVVGLIVEAALLAAPLGFAAESKPDHDSGFVTTVKHDAKTVGAAFKEGAHRVAVASKAVAHEVATAAKRGAAETRAAFRGEKSGAPAS